jgi:hypothetical protein
MNKAKIISELENMVVARLFGRHGLRTEKHTLPSIASLYKWA